MVETFLVSEGEVREALKNNPEPPSALRKTLAGKVPARTNGHAMDFQYSFIWMVRSMIREGKLRFDEMANLHVVDAK